MVVFVLDGRIPALHLEPILLSDYHIYKSNRIVYQIITQIDRCIERAISFVGHMRSIESNLEKGQQQQQQQQQQKQTHHVIGRSVHNLRVRHAYLCRPG